MSMICIVLNMEKTTREMFLMMEKRIEELEREVARLKFLLLPKDMSLQEQSKALVEHKDTPMTYQEMRERFG